MSDQTNSSSKAVCPEHHAALPEKPFISQGDVHFAAHQVGWIVCGFFTIISVGVSAWLINKHLRNYTNKGQQRYIVRCLFMVPIYSIISTLSYILYDSYASPLIIIRDCYEAVVLHAFFYLLLEYISHDEEEQKEAFREIKLKKWMFPLGFIRKKPSGLYFLQIMKWGVLQYAVLRPACTLASLILNWFGWYCEASWSPVWGHIYLVTIISISVTVAMYCLLQLYMPISDLLKPYHPILKFLSVKAVVFLTFWQATFLAVLASFGVVKDTPYMTAEEINIGFGALLETFEMVIFAFLHLKAFTYLPYKPKPEDRPDFKPTPRLRSLGHVFDFRDMFRQIWKGCVYMWHRIRGYEPDTNERYSHFQRALGQRRLRGSGDKEAREFDRLAQDDPFDRRIPPQREHPWLKLDSPTSPVNSNQEGPEEEISAELRRIRAAQEHNRRQKQLREERRERRMRKSGSSSHRRDAAAVEKYEHLPTGGEDIFTRMDEPDEEDTFPKRGDGYRAAPGKPSFWRGWYDRISQAGDGGGEHRAVPQADEDFYDPRAWSSPTRLLQNRDDLYDPSPRHGAPRETGMVVLSRPTRSTSPPPPIPPPKDPHLLSPPGAGAPQRADSFMRRVFTAEVASSAESHTASRSSMNASQELLGPLSTAWAPDPIAEASESTTAPAEQVAMKNVAGRYSQSPQRRDNLILPPPSSNVASVPVKMPSPKQSQQGSVYGGSTEGPPSSSSSHRRPQVQSQPQPPPQSQEYQRVQSRGPRRPADIVLPTPLSPARYPGVSSPPTSPSNPSPPRLPRETQAIVGSGSRYPVFIPSPPPMRRASLVGEGRNGRTFRPRASSQEREPRSSRSGRRSTIDGYPGGDRPPRQMAPGPSNQPPAQRLPNSYQAVEFPMPEIRPQSAASRDPQASWATSAPSGLAPNRTSDILPRPPPGAQIPRSPHAMTRDPVDSFSPMTDRLWR